MTEQGDPFPKCCGCGQVIRERYVFMVQQQPWHSSCLRCSKCQESLTADERCFSKEGQLYCRRDYLRLFGQSAKCLRCQETIAAGEDCMRASLGYLHMACLACALCKQPLQPHHQFCIHSPGTLVCSGCKSHALLTNISDKRAVFGRGRVCSVENLTSRQTSHNPTMQQVS